MGLKAKKPITPGQRGKVIQTTDDITVRTPKKSLVEPLKKNAGRNSSGRITVRHRGGGHKRKLRKIDFKRDNFGVPGEVTTIEYAPNRSSRIALVKYRNGDWRYILAVDGMNVGDNVESGENAEIASGNALPLKSIPSGIFTKSFQLVFFKGIYLSSIFRAY